VSQENVEAVRRGYDVAFAERSVENVRDEVHEDFVWHQRPEWPGLPEYRIDDLPQLWADLDETYTEFGLVPEDFSPIGDYVLVTTRATVRMRTGDAQIDTTLYHLWHVVDGKVREGWAFGSRAEALEASSGRR
jgi:ketosteroid isomerase-like protein